jgi:hypothetical protein
LQAVREVQHAEGDAQDQSRQIGGAVRVHDGILSERWETAWTKPVDVRHSIRTTTHEKPSISL